MAAVPIGEQPLLGSTETFWGKSSRSVLNVPMLRKIGSSLDFHVKLTFKIWATHSKFLKPSGPYKKYLQIRFDPRVFSPLEIENRGYTELDECAFCLMS